MTNPTAIPDDVPKWLAESKARWEASTPGPWEVAPISEWDKSILINFPNGCGACFAEVSYDDVWDGEDENGNAIDGASQQEAAADFIAHAHQDIPMLLALVERLQAELHNELDTTVPYSYKAELDEETARYEHAIARNKELQARVAELEMNKEANRTAMLRDLDS